MLHQRLVFPLDSLSMHSVLLSFVLLHSLITCPTLNLIRKLCGNLNRKNQISLWSVCHRIIESQVWKGPTRSSSPNVLLSPLLPLSFLTSSSQVCSSPLWCSSERSAVLPLFGWPQKKFVNISASFFAYFWVTFAFTWTSHRWEQSLLSLINPTRPPWKSAPCPYAVYFFISHAELFIQTR